ncbi:hypothetical protein [Gordonia westfalica]|nr:hypothetical protein [Gordonia westfalica]
MSRKWWTNPHCEDLFSDFEYLLSMVLGGGGIASGGMLPRR